MPNGEETGAPSEEEQRLAARDAYSSAIGLCVVVIVLQLVFEFCWSRPLGAGGSLGRVLAGANVGVLLAGSVSLVALLLTRARPRAGLAFGICALLIVPQYPLAAVI